METNDGIIIISVHSVVFDDLLIIVILEYMIVKNIVPILFVLFIPTLALADPPVGYENAPTVMIPPPGAISPAPPVVLVPARPVVGPRRDHISDRINHQEHRVNRLVSMGRISPSKAAYIHHEHERIRREMHEMAERHAGALSIRDVRILNRQLNSLNRQIDPD